LPHGRGQTVLVVDNEQSLVALAEETLAELGYEPVGFGLRYDRDAFASRRWAAVGVEGLAP
jgi:hypothetical protein